MYVKIAMLRFLSRIIGSKFLTFFVFGYNNEQI